MSCTSFSYRIAKVNPFPPIDETSTCYDANGRMLEVQTLAKAGDLKLNMSSAKIRLFLLDKNSKPVCAAVTVKETTS